MNLSKIALPEVIVALLARGEPLTAAQLATATGKTQASISLGMKALGERVHRMGAARSTRYALKKDILGLPADQDLVWNGGGAPEHWGQLTYLHGDSLLVRHGKREWFTRGKLPWFLTSLRPEGFLGRQLASRLQHLPSDPEQWSLAQTLSVAVQFTKNPPGAFDLGPIEGRLVDEVSRELEERLAQYDQRARHVGQSVVRRSSAGGEQPKFLAEHGPLHSPWQHSIIKFSPPHGTPFGERWGALLSLEHLALATLAAHGIAVAQSKLLRSSERSYLESARFDRVGIEGYRHVVAIRALHDEFVGGPQRHWVQTCQALAAQKLVTDSELQQVATVHAFGHYIGNTDMHFGNLSFFVDDVVQPKISLAPIYDMLPMMWRPDIYQGDLSDSPVREQRLPTDFPAEQAQARAWAIEFWNRAAQLDIGADLQAASAESARRLQNNFASV